MSARTARWIAWSLVAAYITLATIGLTLQFLTNTSFTNIAFPILLIIIPLVGIWPVIGALVISRHPRHPVGWLLCIGLLAPAFDMFFSGYVSYDINVFAGTLPGITTALIWLKWSGFPIATTAFTLMILLFPDGHLPSPFGRKLAWTAVGTLLIYLPIQAVEPGIVDPFTSIRLDNPLAVSQSVWVILRPLWLLGLTMLALSYLAAVISLVLRLRRAQGDERQQIKWLLVPAAGYFAAIPFTSLGLVESSSLLLGIAIALTLPSVAGMVIATAVAVFRYRLYDLDLIVNRSLVYGALTASVAGLYVLIVGGAGLLIQTNLSLAGLLITVVLAAAIFRPMRAFFQGGADRLVPFAPTYLNTPASSTSEPSGRSWRRLQETLEEQFIGEQAVETPIHLPAWMRPLLRAMWLFWAAVVLGIIILGIPSQIDAIAETTAGGVTGAAPWTVAGVHVITFLTESALSFICLVLAGVIYLKRPKQGMALFLSYFLLANGIVAAPFSFLEPFLPRANVFQYSVVQPLIFGPLLVAFLSTFPNGRLVPSWTRWLIVAAVIYAPVGPIIFTSQAYSEPTPIYIAGVLTWFVLILTGFYAQIYRYRHVSNSIERQQIKWVIFGFTLTALFVCLTTLWTISSNLRPENTTLPWWAPLVGLGWRLAHSTLPIALTFAVLRYRLFEIDIIINRTLVYGGLTVSVAAIYALIVGGVGVLLQAEGNLLVALVATGLVAVLFQPLRERLQRAVNRLTYGERDEPFEALSRLGRRLEGTFSPEMVYPAIVETVAQALRLPYAALAVKRGEQYEIAETFGSRSDEPEVYPLVHHGDVVGRLLVSRRTADEDFSAADQRLLRNFARQAGTAVHAAQLMADLQRSRQQLVTTREEERLRLRRDLHDGLGPALASIVWQADSARDLVYTDPAEAVQLLESSIEQAQAALTDIRRLVYGLRPPALDELGLVGALEQAARQHAQTAVTVEASAALPSLPAAVEVAAYRIAQEALKNAAEHGQAAHCAVSLAADGALQLTVRDDGVGLPQGVTPGVGLVSMRERAEELGGAFSIRPRPAGGTEVEVCLPLTLGQ